MANQANQTRALISLPTILIKVPKSSAYLYRYPEYNPKSGEYFKEALNTLGEG